MGMYTELLLKCEIKSEIPSHVNAILKSFVRGGDLPESLPNHDFFRTPRFAMIFSSSSYYHHPKALRSLEGSYLFVRSDLKNYDNEISKFIDWLSPYLRGEKGDCIGYEWYEEEDEPTLIHIN